MKLIAYLKSIKKRPGMYMSEEGGLKDLEFQLWGYTAALHFHNINDDILDFNAAFGEYIQAKYDWSTNTGWAEAIIRNTENSEDALNAFFESVNQFFSEKYKLNHVFDE